MKAVRYRVRDGEPRLGRLEGEAVVDAGPAGPAGFVPTPPAWAALETAAGERRGLGDVTLLHPVVPGKILGIGLNYRDHAAESGRDIPTVPVVFAKWASSLIGPGEPIRVPREETRPDFEGEVGIVIGRRAYRTGRDEALDAVGGVTIVHDVSGRRAQYETPLQQFTLAKSFDTFTPLGPCVASPDGLDLAGLGIRTVVSGEEMQSSNTAQLIFPAADLIEYLSRGLTLEAGDVIATGTPGGVGDGRTPPRYLREGDVVEITVDGVGTLRNPVTMEA